ncbi:MAG: ABC transporter ATP-binding protein/permease [Bacteriovoracaceae bacterium]|nr:ABC transporter ATP-binding protein/permease [Bacteriovoracaceae bacterium]
MDHLELREQEDEKYRFSPFGLKFTQAQEWDGALSDTKWLWPWVKPHRLRLSFALVLFFLTTLISVATPRLVAKIVDDVLVAKTASFAFWGVLLGSLMLLKIIADLSYKWMVTKIGQRITKQLRNDIFHQLGDFPLNFFDKNSSGRLISRCVNDVSNLSAFFTSNFFTVISDIVLIIGCVIIMLTLSVKSTLLVILTLIPMVIFMLNVSQAQMRWGRTIRNILSRLSSHTGDSMNNLAVLHSQPFALKWAKRHQRLQDLYSTLTMRNIITWGSFSSAHVLVMGITYAMVITLGVYQLKMGEITIGTLIATFTYVGLIFGPFLEISEKLNVMVTALGSVKRLRDLLPEQITTKKDSAADSGQVPHGPIRFQDIKFSYRSDVPLFENFNLELPEGEVTALVGRTGSGKTTLAHLMLGLYPITHGKILWGDEDIQAFPPARRARWIGHVSQDLFIFTDTIRENLRLWREDITDEEISERLRLVGLYNKIMNLPGGLDMIVKAETLPLSQGEKQLLLLCRALLQDPRLLVFDEATASLDQLTEEEWLGHVGKLFQGRTTLFIAHRMETLRLATFIVVLENGKIKKSFRKAAGKPVTEADLSP